MDDAKAQPRYEKPARLLGRKLDVEVEPNAYCLGYWRRIDNQPKPKDAAQHRGWDEADHELRAGDLAGNTGE